MDSACCSVCGATVLETCRRHRHKAKGSDRELSGSRKYRVVLMWVERRVRVGA